MDLVTWARISKNSPECQTYERCASAAFGGPPSESSKGGADIGAFYRGELVGGITLKRYECLTEDPGLTKYWNVFAGRKGTRMSRMWTKPCRNTQIVPAIFEGVAETEAEDTFLYGVLGLPLSYALKQKEFLNNHESMVFPKVSLENSNWSEEENASTEGRRVFRTYLKYGVKILGAPCASAEDKTVRIALGLDRAAVDLSLGLRKRG